MGRRRSKSVKICKGLSVSFNKSGVKLRLGSSGRKRAKFSSRSKSRSSSGNFAAYHKAISDIASYTGQSNFEFDIVVEEDGVISFVTADGIVIADPNLISLLKKHPSYVSQKKSIQAKSHENAEAYARALQEQTDSFLNIYKLAPYIMTTEDVLGVLESLTPKVYECLPFEVAAPDLRSIEIELEQEANSTIKALLPGKKKKLVAEYVAGNAERIYTERMRIWSAEKQAHDSLEEIKKQEFDAQGIEEFKKNKAMFAGWLEGDGDLLEQEIASWLSSLELPVEINVDYDYSSDTGVLSIDLDLPEIEDLPTTCSVQLASGKYKEKNKTQKQLKEEYIQCILGLVVFIATNMFNAGAAVREVAVSGYTQRRNKAGAIQDDYIVSVRFDRSTLESLPYSQSNPMETILRFENRVNIASSGQFKVIEPL